MLINPATIIELPSIHSRLKPTVSTIKLQTIPATVLIYHHKELLCTKFQCLRYRKYIFAFKVVLEGCCRCPDSHDLSAYQKSSPSYKLNSLNFDSEKLSVETLWDHLKAMKDMLNEYIYVYIGKIHVGSPMLCGPLKL